MTGTWTPKSKYYTIIDVDQLQEILDSILVQIVGYDTDIEWKLEDVCRSHKYLEDNKVAISVQISNPSYTNERVVLDFMTEQDFDLAKYYFQVDEFLTLEEYRELTDININLK